MASLPWIWPTDSLRRVRLLDRYLLTELMVPLAITLTSFVLLFLMADIISNMDDIRERHWQLHDAVEYYFYRTAKTLSEGLVPIGLMLATMYALANDARNNDLTAIRAAGVGMWRLLLPYLAVGVFFSVFLFVLNEYLIPDADQKMRQVERRYTDESAESSEGQLKDFQFHNEKDNREWLIGVFDMRTASLTNVTIQWKQPDGKVQLMQAESAAWANGGWEFFDVNLKLLDPADPTRNPNLGRSIPRTNLVQFYESPEQIWSEFSVSQLSVTTGAKRAVVSLGTLFDYFALHPDLRGAKRSLLLTQLHARIAVPWTCLVVMLIAMPFAVPSGRRNLFFGATAGLSLCFAFFILQRFGLALGTGGHLPPWLAAWLPNLLFSTLAIILISRAR
jgi:lipopolysaccharide export system permease protein